MGPASENLHNRRHMQRSNLLFRGRDASYLAPPPSGRVEARTGLRMMQTFPRPSLSFRTAGRDAEEQSAAHQVDSPAPYSWSARLLRRPAWSGKRHVTRLPTSSRPPRSANSRHSASSSAHGTKARRSSCRMKAIRLPTMSAFTHRPLIPAVSRRIFGWRTGHRSMIILARASRSLYRPVWTP